MHTADAGHFCNIKGGVFVKKAHAYKSAARGQVGKHARNFPPHATHFRQQTDLNSARQGVRTPRHLRNKYLSGARKWGLPFVPLRCVLVPRLAEAADSLFFLPRKMAAPSRAQSRSTGPYWGNRSVSSLLSGWGDERGRRNNKEEEEEAARVFSSTDEASSREPCFQILPGPADRRSLTALSRITFALSGFFFSPRCTWLCFVLEKLDCGLSVYRRGEDVTTKSYRVFASSASLAVLRWSWCSRLPACILCFSLLVCARFPVMILDSGKVVGVAFAFRGPIFRLDSP